MAAEPGVEPPSIEGSDGGLKRPGTGSNGQVQAAQMGWLEPEDWAGPALTRACASVRNDC
jgi:hypothetical protein